MYTPELIIIHKFWPGAREMRIRLDRTSSPLGEFIRKIHLKYLDTGGPEYYPRGLNLILSLYLSLHCLIFSTNSYYVWPITFCGT